MSGASSMYGSTTEEQRQANEVRRLKRELTEAREQVLSLSSQLSTNVSTFIKIPTLNIMKMHKVCHVSNSNSKAISVQYLNCMKHRFCQKKNLLFNANLECEEKNLPQGYFKINVLNVKISN